MKKNILTSCAALITFFNSSMQAVAQKLSSNSSHQNTNQLATSNKTSNEAYHEEAIAIDLSPLISLASYYPYDKNVEQGQNGDRD